MAVNLIVEPDALRLFNDGGTTLELPYAYIEPILVAIDTEGEHWVGPGASPFATPDGEPTPPGVWLPGERDRSCPRALIPFGPWRLGYNTALEISRELWHAMLAPHATAGRLTMPACDILSLPEILAQRRA